MTLFVLALALLVFLGLAYAGRAFWGAIAATALLLWLFGSSLPAGLVQIGAGALVAVAVLFGIRPVRAALFGKPVLKLVGGILPRMSETEKEALDAGTVWWDGELFSGDPNWRKLLEYESKELSQRERDFLDNEVVELCEMLDDHLVAHRGDLPPEAWDFIKAKGFMGMIIPESYGGLGFSAQAQSAVIARLSAHCGTASVTVMVPNSLGPAELLLHYGTQEQRDRLLPRLARGEEVPAFALTEPNAGSDAASMTSTGVVCRGEFQGREVLGMRLNWTKRYITLAPIATLLGLAFKLSDPDHLLGEQEDLGITCALIPTDLEGVITGRRHDPLGVPFMNGPTEGRAVFVPLDFIIGGAENAGKGWRMLMQSLAAGRGISLPSLSSGAAQLSTRVTGAYATLREQFNLPIGRFEGIETPLARITGLNYLIEGGKRMTLGAIDAGEKPSVVTAIMKCYTTEAMRVVINDAMDVVGGAGICRGPRNTLATSYQAIPIGITVEGANILTRSMIIFGQGASRCHPFVQDELNAAAAKNATDFDRAFFGHTNFVFTNVARSLLLGLTGGRLVSTPGKGATGAYFQQLTRFSASFALVADFAMATLGGALKRKENITGRLSDALAHLYLGSGVLKNYIEDGRRESDRPAMKWAMEHSLYEIQEALAGVLDNLPNRPAAWLLKVLVFPLGKRHKRPSDRTASRLARAILEGGQLREDLTRDIWIPAPDRPGLGQLEASLQAVLAARPAKEKLKRAQRERTLPKRAPNLLEQAVHAGILDETEAQLLEKASEARDAAVAVDAFEDLGDRARSLSSKETAPAF